MYDWYVQISTYFLTYLIQGSRCIQSSVRGSSSQCIGSVVVPPLNPKLLVWGTKPLEAGEYISNKYEIWKSPKISVIPSAAFPNFWTKNNFATARRLSPVLSTVDRRPSPVDHTQRPALCTARWRLGVTQRVALSVGVSQDLVISLLLFLCTISTRFLRVPQKNLHSYNLNCSEIFL